MTALVATRRTRHSRCTNHAGISAAASTAVARTWCRREQAVAAGAMAIWAGLVEEVGVMVVGLVVEAEVARAVRVVRAAQGVEGMVTVAEEDHVRSR